MEHRGFHKMLTLAGASIAAMATDIGHAGSALASVAEQKARRIFGSDNIRRYINRYGRTRSWHRNGSIALHNRHGGPHLHLRERARNLHPPGARREAWLKQAREAA